MCNHQWCRDVRRDEAVRAAEDAAAVPAIQHRDLPEVVAALTKRVARLEAAAGTAGGDDAVVVPQTVVAGNFAQIHWNTCCRLHRMAMDKAGVRWTQSTEPSRPESEEAGNAGGEQEPPRGWLTVEEREAVHVMALVCDRTVDAPRANTLRALLARETPPRVKVPPLNAAWVDFLHERDGKWRDAIRAAGGEVEG